MRRARRGGGAVPLAPPARPRALRVRGRGRGGAGGCPDPEAPLEPVLRSTQPATAAVGQAGVGRCHLQLPLQQPRREHNSTDGSGAVPTASLALLGPRRPRLLPPKGAAAGLRTGCQR